MELTEIKTSGDKIQDIPLAKVGGKGLFTKEIEESLLRNETDIAVHSMKDVPIKLPPGLALSIVTKREDPRDALISNNNVKLDDLSRGACVGTGSFRRTTQLLAHRPDLEVVPMRGTVGTRLKKLETEGLDFGQFSSSIVGWSLATRSQRLWNYATAPKKSGMRN